MKIVAEAKETWREVRTAPARFALNEAAIFLLTAAVTYVGTAVASLPIWPVGSVAFVLAASGLSCAHFAALVRSSRAKRERSEWRVREKRAREREEQERESDVCELHNAAATARVFADRGRSLLSAYPSRSIGGEDRAAWRMRVLPWRRLAKEWSLQVDRQVRSSNFGRARVPAFTEWLDDEDEYATIQRKTEALELAVRDAQDSVVRLQSRS